MRTKKTLLTLALLFAVLPVFADEYCNLELVDSWTCPTIAPSSIWNSGIAYNNGYLYVPGIDHIYIVEAEDSGSLEFERTQVDLADDYIGDVVVRNNLAFVSNAYNMLIYDVSDPLNFDSLGSCPVHIVNQIFLLDSLAVTIGNGLHVINIADSTNPYHIRGYAIPWDDYFLPYVSQDIYPYVLVPCGIEFDDPGEPYHWYDSYINVIDITQTYSYSPQLNEISSTENNYILALDRVGEYYFGLTYGPIVTIYEMDSSFAWTLPKTGWRNSAYEFAKHSSVLNDSIVFLGTQNEFYLMNFADTSYLDIIASFENTDENYEYYREAVAVDSFLYVFVTLAGEGVDDQFGILSFKLDMSFSGQCAFNQQPKQMELESFPNPFNSSCTIKYSMGMDRESVDVGIFDIRGKKVFAKDNLKPEGKLIWEAGAESSGVYLVRLSNSSTSITKKVIYVG